MDFFLSWVSHAHFLQQSSGSSVSEQASDLSARQAAEAVASSVLQEAIFNITGESKVKKSERI